MLGRKPKLFGERCRPKMGLNSIASWTSTLRRWRHSLPGALIPEWSQRLLVVCLILLRRWKKRRGAQPSVHSITWLYSQAQKSLTFQSIVFSSDHAPIRESKICARPHESSMVIELATPCVRWLCRARKASSNSPKPKASIKSSRTPASNGANQAARCVWA